MAVQTVTAHNYLSLCCSVLLIRLINIQEESSALKYSQYCAFNSFPTKEKRDSEQKEERKGRQKYRDAHEKRKISQDKKPVIEFLS